MTIPDPLLTFREYVKRVVGNSSRGEELKTLIQFFGLEKIERVLEGKSMIEPKDFLGGGQ